MSTVKSMQEWCRLQCQNYPGVEIRDFSTSFRDGMVFCALIHRHRPDLLDFDSLSKDNVYENNRLAFEVAEQQLGIPALLDPTDMVTMKVPDRLSILTYLSQYYNYFRNPPPAGVPHPLAVKRSATLCSSEPALKKTTESASMPQGEEESCEQTRQTFLNSTCASCHQHVHLVQRYLVEGRLYHRLCFRCKECCSTLLPGSYRPGSESGTYVCTHHRSKGIINSQSTPDILKDDGVIVRKEDLDKDQKGRKDEHLNAVGDVSVSLALPAEVNAPSARPSVPNRSEENDTFNLEAVSGAPLGPVSEPPLVVQSPHEQTGVGNLRPKIHLKPTIPCKPTSLQDQKCAASQVNDPSGLQTITLQEQIGNSPNIDHRQAISSVKIQDQISSLSQKSDPVDDLVPSNIVNQTAASSVSCVPTEECTVKIHSDPADTAASVNELQMPDTESSKGELENRPIPAARRATGAVVVQLPPPVPRPRTSLPGDRETETGPFAVMQVTNGAQLEELTPPVPKPRVRPKSSERMVNGRLHKEPPWIALVQMEKKRKAAPPPPGMPPRAEDQHSSPLQDREGRPSSRKSPQPKPYNPFEDDEEEEEAKEGSLAPGHPWYGITPTSSPKARKRAAPKAPGASPIARHTSLLSASRVSHSEPSSCTPSPALSIESLSSDSPLNETVSKSSSEPTVHAAPLDTANATPAPVSVSANELANHGTGSATSPSSSRSSSCGSLRSSPHRPPPKPPAPTAAISSVSENTSAPSPPPKTPPKSSCKENPFNRKTSPAASPVTSPSVRKSTKGPKPARPPAPGHGFPLVKRKVQADEYIPEEDIHGELNAIERQLDEMERSGIELEGKLRSVDSETVDDDELLVDWFRLIHEKHMLVRRESELVYVIKQQNLEQRQADVEYELRCLLNKPEKDWTDDDRDREQVLMKEIVIIIEQRNAIVTCLDEDRQREEEEDKLLAAMIKKKDFLKDPEASMTKKKGKFKPLKVLKRLSSKPDPKTKSPSDKS